MSLKSEELPEILEPGIYYIDGKKVIVYERVSKEEILEEIKANDELIEKYGEEGWI